MTEKIATPRRALSWHPFAFAAWPVLTLYHDNIGETPPYEALRMLGLTLLVTAALFAVAVAVLRDLRRAALVTSILVVAILMWGAARDAIDEAAWLFPAWVAAVVLLVLAVVRVRKVLAELTTVAAAMSAVVLAMSAIPVLIVQVPAWAATRGLGAETADLDDQVGQWSAPGEPRDIYYLIFDRYGSQRAMEERWEMDLEPFFAGLRDRGFRVAPDSKANHLRTAQSLSSSLNLQYHFDLAERYGTATGNMLPVYDRLQNHAVGRLLKDRGYTYVHIGAWWDPTQTNRNADVNAGYEDESDFERIFFRSTLLSHFERRPTGVTLAEQNRRRTYRGSLSQFEEVRRASERPGPTFTFAHILLPHEPFVFDINGDYVTRDEEGQRGRRLSYVEQTLYTNQLIDALLDDLLDVPDDERPIIILQADEGPHPVRFKLDERNFNWVRATDAELEEKFAILNAFLLPDADDAPLYDSISPVNTWRVIFNAYFGAELPLLDDRSFVFRDENHVYDFTEVTERLGGPITVGP
jgi:hypothetical protein